MLLALWVPDRNFALVSSGFPADLPATDTFEAWEAWDWCGGILSLAVALPDGRPPARLFACRAEPEGSLTDDQVAAVFVGLLEKAEAAGEIAVAAEDNRRSPYAEIRRRSPVLDEWLGDLERLVPPPPLESGLGGAAAVSLLLLLVIVAMSACWAAFAR